MPAATSRWPATRHGHGLRTQYCGLQGVQMLCEWPSHAKVPYSSGDLSSSYIDNTASAISPKEATVNSRWVCQGAHDQSTATSALPR